VYIHFVSPFYAATYRILSSIIKLIIVKSNDINFEGIGWEGVESIRLVQEGIGALGFRWMH
jgi:hypothetical protein